jgi:hypothetical protein
VHNSHCTPMKSSSSFQEMNTHSTPCSSLINPQRISHICATPQDCLKMHRVGSFFGYPKKADEWSVSERTNQQTLDTFWMTFHPPCDIHSCSPALLGQIFSYLTLSERQTVQVVSRQWCLSLHFLLSQEICLLPDPTPVTSSSSSTSVSFSLSSTSQEMNGVTLLNSSRWNSDFVNFFSEVSLVGDGTSKKVYSLELISHSSDLSLHSTKEMPFSLLTPLTSSLTSSLTSLILSSQAVVVSVMDLHDLFSREISKEMIETELQISLLSSSLCSLQICPCLLQTHFLFRSNQLLHENTQLNLSHTSKRTKGGGRRRRSEINRLKEEESREAGGGGGAGGGRYLYVGMERCNGNLEEYLEELSQSSVSSYCLDSSILAVFFQICYALYVCREKMCLIHYDLKLLNCLYAKDRTVFSSSAPTSSSSSTEMERSALRSLSMETEDEDERLIRRTRKGKINQPESTVTNVTSVMNRKQSKTSHSTSSQCEGQGVKQMHIGFKDRLYSLPIHSSIHNTCGLVKLIDFGTSVIGGKQLGTPIGLQQVLSLLLSIPYSSFSSVVL